MSEKADALFGAFVTLTALKDHFDNRFKELLRAKGCREWNDDYEIYEAYGEGDARMLQLKTRDRDGDADHQIPLADLDVDVDELNRRERERIEKEQAATKARHLARAAQEAAAAELRDQAEFKRLTAKYVKQEMVPGNS